MPHSIQSLYTHNLALINSNEFIRNIKIDFSQDKKTLSISPTSLDNKQSKRTIILPGFINLHAHLLYERKLNLKKQNLFLWLKELLNKQANIYPDNFSKKHAISNSIDEALSYGTTFIIDNSFYPELSFEEFIAKKIKGIIGVEIFGSDPAQAEQIWQEKIQLIKQLENKLKEKNYSEKIDFCLSPHASYDVSKELWQKSLAWTIAHNQSKPSNKKLVLSHLAESQAEEAWFQDKFSDEAQVAREFWQSINTLQSKLNAWQPHKSSVDFFCNSLITNFSHENDLPILLTHLCYASPEEIKALASLGIKACTCPRSNEYLENELPDITMWSNEKLDFAFGTDSLASNYDLDLRKEVQKFSSLNAQKKFYKLTEGAAKILGRDKEIGTLKDGKAADFIVLELLDPSIDLEQVCPYELALDSKKTQVITTVIDGEIVFSKED